MYVIITYAQITNNVFVFYLKLFRNTNKKALRFRMNAQGQTSLKHSGLGLVWSDRKLVPPHGARIITPRTRPINWWVPVGLTTTSAVRISATLDEISRATTARTSIRINISPSRLERKSPVTALNTHSTRLAE